MRTLPDSLSQTVAGRLATAVDGALRAPAAIAAVAGLVAAIAADDGDAAFEALAVAGAVLTAVALVAQRASRRPSLLAALGAPGCFIAAGLPAG